MIASDLAFGSASPTSQPGVFSYAVPSYSALLDRTGVVYWQAYIIDYQLDPDLYAEGPIQAFSAAEQRSPLVGAAGVSNGKGFYINPALVGIGVSYPRFEELVRRAAARWRLPFLGLTGAKPGVRDGFNVVGFSFSTVPGALGVTTTYFRPRIRVKRVCRITRTASGGRKRVCRGRRYVAGRVKTGERDVELSMSVVWQDGPRRPTTSEFDLESTVTHEMGHFAGNAGHVFGCVNSPMIAGLSRGEFWRDFNQVALFAC